MKGQYLAVETVFTFGLGLMVAIGVIVLFDEYRISVMDEAEPQQVDYIQAEVLNSLEALREIDESQKGSGNIKLDLPRTLAGKDYSIDMNRRLVINVQNRKYRSKLKGFQDYEFEGGASGGDITIFKNEDQYTMRAR